MRRRVIATVSFTRTYCETCRCHLCGDVFMAERPEGIGDQKHDPSAVSMMAMMRYGLGMAMNRSAMLQQSMGIPLPASTQWEVVSSHADGIVPVYQYLAFQAAQGEVVYHDDTTGRRTTRKQAGLAKVPEQAA